MSLWLYDFFLQILTSYCKFLMPRPLKGGILVVNTIILSKNFHKNASMQSWISGNCQNWQIMKVSKHSYCSFIIINFFGISYFILQTPHAKAFKMRYTRYQYKIFIYPKIFTKTLENSFSWISRNWQNWNNLWIHEKLFSRIFLNFFA